MSAKERLIQRKFKEILKQEFRIKHFFTFNSFTFTAIMNIFITHSGIPRPMRFYAMNFLFYYCLYILYANILPFLAVAKWNFWLNNRGKQWFENFIAILRWCQPFHFDVLFACIISFEPALAVNGFGNKILPKSNHQVTMAMIVDSNEETSLVRI